MPKNFTDNEWIAIADFIKAELVRREGAEIRKDKERQWKEVDRQVAMQPVSRETSGSDEQDWFPNTELPWQFNALEVVAADARALKFPRTTEWFRVQANVSEKYLERWRDRRSTKREEKENQQIFESKNPIIDGAGIMQLDQETANILIKGVFDHYHRLYDFRSQIDLLDTQAIKYGTFVARVRPVKLEKFSNHFRGAGGIMGPAVIPCDIKKTYLDDSPPAVLHEGISPAPTILRKSEQRLEDMLAAAKTGGRDRGWILDQVKLIEDTSDVEGRKNIVDIIEAEGDLYVPQTGETLILPNVIVTVAVSSGVARPIRFQETPTPFRSYVSGHYMRDDITSPYGSSPLMKGVPIQEAGTLTFNNMMAVAALKGLPPIAYDRNDTNLIGTGGPRWHPGATFPTDAPNSIEVLETGDLGGLLSTYQAILKHYEDMTGVNDPRRGAPVRSHTTKGAAELEASRGIARTDDYVVAQEMGPLTSMLYMEWEIIKDIMKTTQPVFIGGGGIEGWVNVSKHDLADDAIFFVEGSAGVANERERAENFIGASNFALQTAGAAAKLGKQINLRFEEIIAEGYKRAGENNPSRFIAPSEKLPTGSESGPDIPGVGRQVSEVPPEAVQSQARG